MPIFSFGSSAKADEWLRAQPLSRRFRLNENLVRRFAVLQVSCVSPGQPGRIGMGLMPYPTSLGQDRAVAYVLLHKVRRANRALETNTGLSPTQLLKNNPLYGQNLLKQIEWKSQLRIPGGRDFLYETRKRVAAGWQFHTKGVGPAFEPQSCPDCGCLLLPSGLGTRTLGTRCVCESCSDNYRYTTDTRTYLHQDAAYYCDHNENYYEYEENMPSYDDDDDDYERTLAGLHDYHDHPRRSDVVCYHRPEKDDPEFHAKAPICLGFEWEVECDDPGVASRKFDDRDLPFLGEADGSISSDYGLEVISGWSTLHTVLGWISEAHRIVDPNGTSNCGLHVNVSGLTPVERVRLHDFYNVPATASLICTVAGRYDTDYAHKRVPLLANGGALSEALSMKRRGEGRTDKYSHVNTCRQNYSEIRIFASSTELSVLKSRLQFAWASCEFVRSCNMYTPLTTESFVKWFNTTPGVAKTCQELRRTLRSFGAHLAKTPAQIADAKKVSMDKKAAKRSGVTVKAVVATTDVSLYQETLRGVPPLRRARALAAARAAARPGGIL